MLRAAAGDPGAVPSSAGHSERAAAGAGRAGVAGGAGLRRGWKNRANARANGALPSSKIPARDHARIVLIPQRADRSGAEREQLAGSRSQSKPASGQDTQDVPVREQRDISIGVAGAFEHRAGASRDLFDAFAVRHRPGPDRPSGSLLPNLGGGPAFVIAVVPFAQVRVDL